jgi:hypothetical protein
MKRWIDFLIKLETKMSTLTGNSDLIESFSMEREVKYNYHYGKEEEKISSSKDSKNITLQPIHLIMMKSLQKASSCRRLKTANSQVSVKLKRLDL